jgi:hypothetical protein
MRAENWGKEELELEGWPVKVITYRIDDSFFTEIESSSSGAVIARSAGKVQQAVRSEAIETATRRLLRTRRLDLSLTVGG